MMKGLGVTLSGLAVAALALASGLTGTPAYAAAVGGSGYVLSIATSPDLNCAAELDGQGQAFAAGNGCGTVVSAHGKLFLPASLPIDGWPGSAGISWGAVSQSVSGAGTPASPYVIQTITVGWGVKVTRSDRFVAGDMSYQTTYQIANTATVGTEVQLYQVAACAFADASQVYGEYDPGLRLVTCRKPAADGSYSSKAAGSQFAGVGSHYFYGSGADLWADVNARSPLPDSVGPGTSRPIDGVIAVSWDKWLDAGQSATFTMRTVFQPEVNVPPPTVSPTAEPTTAAPTVRPSDSNPTSAPFYPYYPSNGGGYGSNWGSAADNWGGQIVAPPDGTAPTGSPSAGSTSSATASPTSQPSGTSVPSPTSTASPSPSEGAGDFLSSPSFYGGLGLLVLVGTGAIFVLRRHGRPE
ncbi:MAG: hypothetical protein LBI84_10985 [Propionibacteriaceae bacterium]|jgi:hypothetical protein|nr:hypothetical protein [Propionibacteriaceae bacterium]